MTKQFFIFTDGSATGNPGPAGWAAVVLQGSRRQEIADLVPWSTVSRFAPEAKKVVHQVLASMVLQQDARRWSSFSKP